MTNEELIEMLRTLPDSQKVVALAVEVTEDKRAYIVHALDGTRYLGLTSALPPNAVTAPDFDKPDITDYGQTVKFGDYEFDFHEFVQYEGVRLP